jgi:hypothetical protein
MAFAADEPGVPGELGKSPSGQATLRGIGAIRSVAEHEVNDDEEFLYLFFPDSDAARQAGLASLRRLDTRLAKSSAPVNAATLASQVASIGSPRPPHS